MRVLEEHQEEMLALREAREGLAKKINEDVSKIVAQKANMTEDGNRTEELEHEIMTLQVQNEKYHVVKEKLIELISEMVKSSAKGKPTAEMVAILQSLPPERYKHRLQTSLLPKQGGVN